MSSLASPERDRTLPLLVIVAALAAFGAALGAAQASGSRELQPCERPVVRGLELACAGEGEGAASLPDVPPAGSRAWLVGQRLDLNRASAADLAKIPGVGKKLAKAIIKARVSQGGFASLDEVDDVRGVGPAKMKLLARYVEVSGKPPAPRDR